MLVCVVFFVNPAQSSGQTQGLLPYLLSILNVHEVVILGEIHRHNESEELAYKITENRITFNGGSRNGFLSESSYRKLQYR